jgi:predicted TIM-barrel fold metal-dependent hydrolase
MKVIDAHFHVWRQADLPWLSGPMQPRIFGPYEPIRRDYPMQEYLADAAPEGVERSVYVQANWPVERAEDEVAWLETLAQETGWPNARLTICRSTTTSPRSRSTRLLRSPDASPRRKPPWAMSKTIAL